MGKVLIAFDTDHIKRYVFGTDTLKEIRGASSRLDRLNRYKMAELAKDYHAIPIFTNGGAGLFLVDSQEQAEKFGKQVQKEYRENTGGGSSITYAIQSVLEDMQDSTVDFMGCEIPNPLALMRYKLRRQKDDSSDIITFPSHPFMYLCESCGVEYANVVEPDEHSQVCQSCNNKREDNRDVKKSIDRYLHHQSDLPTFRTNSPLWAEVIDNLQHLNYDFPDRVDRPQDFNEFSLFKGSRDYMALIYADGNNMGQEIEKIVELGKLRLFAENVDSSVKLAVSNAIVDHLQVKRHMRSEAVLHDGQEVSLFPFDILLLGGDDVVMVTPASVALDVALTITHEFHKLTKAIDPKHEGYTLSVGVVLAPVKYPFGLLLDLAETTLKFAKDEAAKRRLKFEKDEAERRRLMPEAEKKEYNETGMINFMTVLGSTSRNFKKVYSLLKSTREEKKRTERSFYATLRPYNTQKLGMLLNMIWKGHRKGLGRTKLQQLREAILEMNLTASQTNARALWRNWKPDQRDFVIDCLYEFANLYEQERFRPDDPTSLSYDRSFPWFADGMDVLKRKIYRTSLLDFVELYGFVTGEEADSGDEN